jgi:AcrR family transcriptional regulator
MSAERRNNSQARRTQKWLREALLELMKEKAYSKITITELVEKADLSRYSLYAH